MTNYFTFQFCIILLNPQVYNEIRTLIKKIKIHYLQISLYILHMCIICKNSQRKQSLILEVLLKVYDNISQLIYILYVFKEFFFIPKN